MVKVVERMEEVILDVEGADAKKEGGAAAVPANRRTKKPTSFTRVVDVFTQKVPVLNKLPRAVAKFHTELGEKRALVKCLRR